MSDDCCFFAQTTKVIFYTMTVMTVTSLLSIGLCVWPIFCFAIENNGRDRHDCHKTLTFNIRFYAKKSYIHRYHRIYIGNKS